MERNRGLLSCNSISVADTLLDRVFPCSGDLQAQIETGTTKHDFARRSDEPNRLLLGLALVAIGLQHAF